MRLIPKFTECIVDSCYYISRLCLLKKYDCAAYIIVTCDFYCCYEVYIISMLLFYGPIGII